jgi:hypothetical protein
MRVNNRMSRLLAGWFALVMYALASSPLGAGIVAIFGTLDTDHQAMLRMSPTGPCLVLHHQQKCDDHEHHAVARALNFFARPVGETDPDHLVQFSSVDGFWRETQQIVFCNDSDSHTDVIWSESISISANLTRYSLPPPGPPPDTSSDLLCLRSTVLLI